MAATPKRQAKLAGAFFEWNRKSAPKNDDRKLLQVIKTSEMLNADINDLQVKSIPV